MQQAINETNRRRRLQTIYNEEHGIDPQTIRKKVSDILQILESQQASTERRRREATDVKRSLDVTGEDLPRLIMSLEDEMHQAAKELRFEYAARLRDEVEELKREMRQVSEAR